MLSPKRMAVAAVAAAVMVEQVVEHLAGLGQLPRTSRGPHPCPSARRRGAGLPSRTSTQSHHHTLRCREIAMMLMSASSVGVAETAEDVAKPLRFGGN